MIASLLYIPTRGFWAEIYAEEKGNGGDEGRTKLKPPGNMSNVLQRQIGAKTEEDTEGNPHLPTHDKAASNRGGNVLRGKNGDRGRLRTHTEAEQQAADEKLFPGLGETGTDDREETEDGTEEDSTAASKIEVEWIGKPAATMK
jgi:hypothetical protein